MSRRRERNDAQPASPHTVESIGKKEALDRIGFARFSVHRRCPAPEGTGHRATSRPSCSPFEPKEAVPARGLAAASRADRVHDGGEYRRDRNPGDPAGFDQGGAQEGHGHSIRHEQG